METKSKEEILTGITKGWYPVPKDECLNAMQAYADQQTADLTERLAITEANLSREKKMFERVLAEKEEAIAGLKGVLLRIKNGDYVAVDAESALIEIDNIIQQSITKLNINEDDQK